MADFSLSPETAEKFLVLREEMFAELMYLEYSPDTPPVKAYKPYGVCLYGTRNRSYEFFFDTAEEAVLAAWRRYEAGGL